MRPTHQFSQTKTAEIPRSSFDLSHGLKTTFDAGLLVPILSLEVIPGDTINCRASLFGRLATPIKPILDNMYLETFFFFIPWRQTYDDFVKLMGEQENPGDSIDYTIPVLSNATCTELSLYDYLGIPLGTDFDQVPVSALVLRAYYQVYNYWFRDQNLMTSIDVDRGPGPDDWGDAPPLRRRKRKDYVTAGLPFPQKGPAVSIPLGVSEVLVEDYNALNQVVIKSAADDLYYSLDPSGSVLTMGSSVTPGQYVKPMYVANFQGATINDLRESFQIQKLLERDARGGTRYPEILMSHFRVNDPALLVYQRPLYLGGGSTRINVTPVQQTTPGSDPDTPQGNLAAYGTVSDSNHGFTSSFTEHGLVLGIVNVRADLTYQQGLERYWSRQTRYDFYWPVLSHLGEQDVKNKEVFVSNDPAVDDDVFAYMPRYDEYRYKMSLITGLFRSDAAASLDVWHLAQDFAALPALNQAFIEDNPPIDRVVAVPSEPDLLLDVFFKIKAARPLPLYGTPGLIDHF